MEFSASHLTEFKPRLLHCLHVLAHITPEVIPPFLPFSKTLRLALEHIGTVP